MRKISLVDYRNLQSIDSWEPPKDRVDGTVRVHVSACAVCGSDIALYRGKRDLKTEHYFGHEFSGVVIDSGEGANGIRKGSRIATEVSRACGHCFYCKCGMPSLCKSMNNAFFPGGFAEVTDVLNTDENSFVTKVPDDLDDVTASLLEPTNCSFRVADQAHIQPGEKVAVIGMGSMGFITTAIVNQLHAGMVVGIVNKQSRLDLVHKVGFCEGIDSSKEGWEDKVREMFGEGGPDVVIELSGNNAAFNNALRIVRPGGRIVVGSVYSGFADTVELRPIMRKEITIVGAKGPFPSLNPDGTSRSLDMLMKIKDDLQKIITVYDFKDGIQAFEDMMSGKNLKSVIRFD